MFGWQANTGNLRGLISLVAVEILEYRHSAGIKPEAPKPNIIVPVIWIVVVTVSHARVVIIVVPRAAPNHAGTEDFLSDKDRDKFSFSKTRCQKKQHEQTNYALQY